MGCGVGCWVGCGVGCGVGVWGRLRGWDVWEGVLSWVCVELGMGVTHLRLLCFVCFDFAVIVCEVK